MPSISICIPTYNRSAYLAELLDSIIAQNMPDVEVIVSDDASPDDTEAVASRYIDKFEKFTFIRQPVNIGLDRNFLAVIAAASGDYIWLMGDDDRIEPGGGQRVLDALERWPDVAGLTLGVIDYDPTMQRPTGIRKMPPTQKLEGVGTVFGTMAEVLGFMSALVVRRDAWMAVAAEDIVKTFENYYVQVYIVGRIIDRYRFWGVVQEACVGFRTGNDQFLVKLGWLKRLKVDVVAYEQIGDALLSNDAPARLSMRRRIFDTHVMARLHNAKSGQGRTPETGAAAAFLFQYYKALPAFWTRGLPTLFAPGWAIRNARAAYKRFAPWSGAARARRLGER